MVVEAPPWVKGGVTMPPTLYATPLPDGLPGSRHLEAVSDETLAQWRSAALMQVAVRLDFDAWNAAAEIGRLDHVLEMGHRYLLYAESQGDWDEAAPLREELRIHERDRCAMLQVQRGIERQQGRVGALLLARRDPQRPWEQADERDWDTPQDV
jgi:hypothetical protein